VHASRRSVSAGPIHLHPTGPLAERVLLPGDPGRALLLAQSLLEQPTMFNHHRGLWGYTGKAPDGEPLTVQSTGMGGPSAAIVISELADLGGRIFIRVGTCGGLRPELKLGDLIVAAEALPFDGVGAVLGGGESRLGSDPGLRDSLLAAHEEAHQGPVACTDLFYDAPTEDQGRWTRAGALAVEMETAALYALAGRRGLRAASLLLVTDLLGPERARIADEALPDLERRLGEVALRALLS
jgi:DeoD family purine-nucleoside phosphorylase